MYSHLVSPYSLCDMFHLYVDGAASCWQIEGRSLPVETIILGGGKSVSVGPEADWGREITRSPVISAVSSVHHLCWLLPFFIFSLMLFKFFKAVLCLSVKT